MRFLGLESLRMQNAESDPPKRVCESLKPQNCMLFLLDMQREYKDTIKYFDGIVSNSNRLLRAGEVVKLNMVITQTEGSGPIVEHLGVSGYSPESRPKSRLSAISGSVEDYIMDNGYRCAIICGVEAHKAVKATAMKLKYIGVDVIIVVDACSSKKSIERGMGFGYLQLAGCHLMSTETIINNLALNTEHKRQISPIVREESQAAGAWNLDSISEFI